MKVSEYIQYDATGLRDLVAQKQVKPIELVDTAIAQIEHANPRINALTCKLFDEARTKAKGALPKGPFTGVPFLLKDLGSFQKNVPSTFGSRFMRDFKMPVESTTVKRFNEAGLVVLGRTNTPEFGLLPTTEPKAYGPTRNPWNDKHIAGGSSGGSAAAVAARMVPVAHAGDGGGSIRIPASCCGVFGFKPSEGRSPVGPLTGRQWHGLAVEHVITRSVRDSAAFLDILSVPIKGAPIYAPPVLEPFVKQAAREPGRLRIGAIRKPFFPSDMDPQCYTALDDSVGLCEELGHHVEEAELTIDSERVAAAYLVIVAAETATILNYVSAHMNRKPKFEDLELLTHLTARGGHHFSAADYCEAVHVLDVTRMEVAQFFERYDMVMTPTLAVPPPRIGELMPNKLHERVMLELLSRVSIRPLMKLAFKMMSANGFRFTPYSILFNVTGQPAMSVPLSMSEEGLPMGTHLVGHNGADGLLLRLAAQLERARPWDMKAPRSVLAEMENGKAGRERESARQMLDSTT